ncbi:Shedu anti-phage system protein SduA domain-containing protein [Streptomyces syringium]|uniref:Shedu anti-phage system protein SduA domain-containing protein n=1 Tax=Streptomyces syringium TaxID=76729 RepID=UPI003D92ED5C
MRLVQDSLDYAEGRILRPDFEERYRLFQRATEPLSSHQDYAARTLSSTLHFFTRLGNDHLSDHPEATASEVLAHVEAVSRDSRYMQQSQERPGRYRILRGSAEVAAWFEQVFQERVDVEAPEEAARRIVMSPDSLAILAADEEGQLLLQAAEIQRRRRGLKALSTAIEDPKASESDLQRALHGQHWIFGGQFVSQAVQRGLVPGDEVDIPLIRGDGALHIVELKRSMSLRGPLVKRHRGCWVPAAEVHDAVSQAVNYLVGLDEHRLRIRNELGIETRRASAVVLIGHPALQPEVAEEEINEVLRTLNTHVNRVEVVTYKELVDNAERALGGWR